MPEVANSQNFPHEDQGCQRPPTRQTRYAVRSKTLLLSETGNLGRASFRCPGYRLISSSPNHVASEAVPGVSKRTGPQLNPVYTASLDNAS